MLQDSRHCLASVDFLQIKTKTTKSGLYQLWWLKWLIQSLGKRQLLLIQTLLSSIGSYKYHGTLRLWYSHGQWFYKPDSIFKELILSSSRSRSRSGPVQSGPVRSIQVQSGPSQVQSGPVQFRSSQVQSGPDLFLLINIVKLRLSLAFSSSSLASFPNPKPNLKGYISVL